LFLGKSISREATFAQTADKQSKFSRGSTGALFTKGQICEIKQKASHRAHMHNMLIVIGFCLAFKNHL